MKKKTFEQIYEDMLRDSKRIRDRVVYIVVSSIKSSFDGSSGQQVFAVKLGAIEINDNYIAFSVEKVGIATMQGYMTATIYVPYESIVFVFDGYEMT